MRFFVDSADIEEIKKAKALGLADGVTTNPTLIRKSGRDFQETIKEIAELVQGPVNAETISLDTQGILKEGREMAGWASNVTIKIPVTRDGLEAVRILESEGIATTVTLIFSPSQALLAATAGASYICPFVGRLDDVSSPGMGLVGEIMDIYTQYEDIDTQVIVASVRSPNHVVEAAVYGAHGVTVPYKVIDQMMNHPLTENGIQRFLDDWEKAKK
jgi:transaldolase